MAILGERATQRKTSTEICSDDDYRELAALATIVGHEHDRQQCGQQRGEQRDTREGARVGEKQSARANCASARFSEVRTMLYAAAKTADAHATPPSSSPPLSSVRVVTAPVAMRLVKVSNDGDDYALRFGNRTITRPPWVAALLAASTPPPSASTMLNGRPRLAGISPIRDQSAFASNRATQNALPIVSANDERKPLATSIRPTPVEVPPAAIVANLFVEPPTLGRRKLEFLPHFERRRFANSARRSQTVNRSIGLQLRFRDSRRQKRATLVGRNLHLLRAFIQRAAAVCAQKRDAKLVCTRRAATHRGRRVAHALVLG